MGGGVGGGDAGWDGLGAGGGNWELGGEADVGTEIDAVESMEDVEMLRGDDAGREVEGGGVDCGLWRWRPMWRPRCNRANGARC